MDVAVVPLRLCAKELEGRQVEVYGEVQRLACGQGSWARERADVPFSTCTPPVPQLSGKFRGWKP